MIKHVDFEKFLQWNDGGYQGVSIERHLESLVGNEEALAELYTVYWPKDSIRAIVGSSFAVARTVLAVLRDPRTRHMGKPTAERPALLSLTRRELREPDHWASYSEVESATVFRKDRLLPGDLSVDTGFRPVELAEPGVIYRLDLSTLPDS